MADEMLSGHGKMSTLVAGDEKDDVDESVSKAQVNVNIGSGTMADDVDSHKIFKNKGWGKHMGFDPSMFNMFREFIPMFIPQAKDSNITEAIALMNSCKDKGMDPVATMAMMKDDKRMDPMTMLIILFFFVFMFRGGLMGGDNQQGLTRANDILAQNYSSELMSAVNNLSTEMCDRFAASTAALTNGFANIGNQNSQNLFDMTNAIRNSQDATGNKIDLLSHRVDDNRHAMDLLGCNIKTMMQECCCTLGREIQAVKCAVDDCCCRTNANIDLLRCETNSGFKDMRYEFATQLGALSTKMDAQHSAVLIDNERNTNSILRAMEQNRYLDLEQRYQDLKLRESQNTQTAAILAAINSNCPAKTGASS